MSLDQEFPRLPVLERLCIVAEEAKACAPSDIVVIGVQHMLSTTGSLVEAITRLGVEPAKIFLSGKAYSSHLETCLRLKASGINIRMGQKPQGPGDYSRALARDVRELWHDAAKLIGSGTTCIVLDDGGFCIREASRWITRGRAIGIEQTTSGLGVAGGVSFPVIGVASSAVKTLIEPPLIANAIVNKLRTAWGRDLDGPCGIIGCGSIGRALLERLAREGVELLVYDRDPARLHDLPVPESTLCKSLRDLYSAATYVFGCTGSDVSPPPLILNYLSGERSLISCSSGDREFRRLIVWLAKRGYAPLRGEAREEKEGAPFGVLVGEAKHWRIEILNGGYPINFDRTEESVPAEEIQLTRGLLLSALLQAILCVKRTEGDRIGSRSLMLNSLFQSFVVREWLSVRPEARELIGSGLLDKFSDSDWIIKHSGGARHDCGYIASLVSGTIGL